MNDRWKMVILHIVQAILFGFLGFRAIFIEHDSIAAFLVGGAFFCALVSLYLRLHNRRSNLRHHCTRLDMPDDRS